MRRMRYPETSVNNYTPKPYNIHEQQGSQVSHALSLHILPFLRHSSEATKSEIYYGGFTVS